jgi:TATA-binding protein-associated factor
VSSRHVLLFHYPLTPAKEVVQRLDIKVLPYVIFLIVPILGRMSDANDEIRATATNTFASLVKMVPLEVCIITPFP